MALLVAPVPPWLLDLAIAANLAGGAALLVASLLAPEVLSFASFPSLLLFTTLFRLATAVSATRLVLSRGEAGTVIRAFGEVVVAGSYVTGAVVYAVITLAQLLVVSKGSERVAEVAARFTLDALPGKQMSIDAELRAGTLDAAEAHRRRRALEREGQLYGAMDGALKFVKGDAVASVAIVLVNALGGLAAGASRGLSLAVAARRYVLLAIGDGLAAQVPALLISMAAGVVVTRVASEEEGAPLARTIARELLHDPRVPAAAAGLCGLLSIVPGLPAWPFLAVGLGAALATWRGRRGPDPAADRAPATLQQRRAGSTPLVLELSEDLAGLALLGDRLRAELWPSAQEKLARELGLRLPDLDLREAPLPPGRWQLLLDDVPAAGGCIPVDEALALVPPAELELVGIPARSETDPLSGRAVARIATLDAPRAALLAPVRTPLERLLAAVAASLRAHAHLLVGVEEVQGLLDELELTHPALARESARQLPAPLLAEVLKRLLEEGVPVRPLRLLLEALLAAGPARGPEALAEVGRRALRRQLAHLLTLRGSTLEAILLDPSAELTLREALGPGAAAPLPPEALDQLFEQLDRQLQREKEGPLVLLTSADVRRPLRDLVASRFEMLPVLAFDDLPPTQAVRPVGRVRLWEAPSETGGAGADAL